MTRFTVALTDESGENGNADDFEAANEEAAILLAKEKFGPGFPNVDFVRPA